METETDLADSSGGQSTYTGLTRLMGDLESRDLVRKQGEGGSVCYYKNDAEEKRCFLELLVGWQDALDAARRSAQLKPPRCAPSPSPAPAPSPSPAPAPAYFSSSETERECK